MLRRSYLIGKIFAKAVILRQLKIYTMIKEGTKVTWKWGNGTAEGKVKSTFTKEVTRTIEGNEVTRKGDCHIHRRTHPLSKCLFAFFLSPRANCPTTIGAPDLHLNHVSLN